MDKRQEEIRRGHEAKRITEDPLFAEAFDTYQNALITAWKNSGAHSADGRERLWLALQIAGKVRSHFERLITTGRMAQKQIEELYERTD